MDFETHKSDLNLTEENNVPVFSATTSIGDVKIESNGDISHYDDGFDQNTNGNGCSEPNFEELNFNDHDNMELHSDYGSPHSKRSTSGDYVDAVTAVMLMNSGEKGTENDLDLPNSSVSPPVGRSEMKRKEMRKWRRIRREFVKDERLGKDSTKMLKRGSADSADLASPSVVIAENKQKNEGSDSSVNEISHNVLHTDVLPTSASILKSRNDIPRPPGHLRDKQETKVLSGKHSRKGLDTVDAIKKPRGEAINMDKDSTVSSPESDTGSYYSVFMHCPGVNNGQSDKGTDYDGKHGDNGPAGENHQASGNLDPLVDCVQLLQSTQEALEQEIQKFGELGKDLQAYDDDSIRTSGIGPEFCTASSSECPTCDDFGTEIPDALRDKLNSLTKKFEILDIQVEHAKSVVRKKETKIAELSATVNNLKSTNEELQRSIGLHQKNYEEIEGEIDNLCKQKMEAEIQYLAIVTEQKSFVCARTHEWQKVPNLVCKAANRKEKTVGQTGKMPKRLTKFTFCFCTQLIVFIIVCVFCRTQFLPKTTVVLPT